MYKLTTQSGLAIIHSDFTKNLFVAYYQLGNLFYKLYCSFNLLIKYDQLLF